jgi:predicted 2-oxoglutarate/Fe(II)-dependent dioxygenase YbiX
VKHELPVRLIALAARFIQCQKKRSMSCARDSFDFYVCGNFLDAASCNRLTDEIRRSEAGKAVTYGKGDAGSIDERTRRVRRAIVSKETIDSVSSRLSQHLPHLRSHFQIKLDSFEEPQFLWYGPGDFFVAHQDGNTGLIQLDSDRLRRVSLTIFLNGQSDDESPNRYQGGSLVFSDRATDNRAVVRGETGKLVAFRSELTHEVTPIQSGDRFAVVTWCQVMA